MSEEKKENTGETGGQQESVRISKKTFRGLVIGANVVVIGLIVAVVCLAVFRGGDDDNDSIKTDGGTSVSSSEPDKSKDDDDEDSGDNDDNNNDDKDDNDGGDKKSEPGNKDHSSKTEITPVNGGSDDEDDNGGGSGDEKKETKEEKEDTSSDPYTFFYTGGNTWQDGDVTMTGMELGVTNKSGSALNDWKIVLEIEGLTKCEGWCGKYTIKGDTLTITPESYNKDVANGASTQGLGCNIGTKGALKVKKATISGHECTIKSGSVPKNSGNSNNNNNNSNNNNNGGKTGDVKSLLKRTSKAKQGDDWLHTDGNRIYDKDGKEVWITGVNWFGYNTGTNIFDGLWNAVLKDSVEAIADHGFNFIRVPFSAELINNWAAGNYPQANYNNAYNEELNSMNSLQIFDYFLTLAEKNGLKVMIDIHSANTDAAGHNANLWYTDRVSVKDYYSALEWMADRYKDNDTIVAFDLKNEPHGKPNEGSAAAKWDDSKDANNWKYVAETAAGKVLAKNPNVLIMVEGTEIYPRKKGDYSSQDNGDYWFNWWGGNLRGVKDYPVDLGKYQNKLVYSPHDYGPTVYQQPWFEGDYDYDSLMKDCWRDNWFYIYDSGTAPLLIGEWGGFMREPNLTWMTHMRTLIGKYHLHHTFWCFNANSGDTGGLVLDDFKTWDEEKYGFVKKVLWQEGGKFVGLDHEIPLGDGGITLSKSKGL